MKPVYGFENNYTVSENGVIYSRKTKKELKFSSNASSKIDRVRLSDKKYYDIKYLVFKSYYPETDLTVNDERIIFKNGDCRDNSLENLILVESADDRTGISRQISLKYGKEIRPIEGFSNYYISLDGEVFSYYGNAPRLLSFWIGEDGYKRIKIPNDKGMKVHLKIHRLVAATFCENPHPEEYNIVHHKDNNKLNNFWTNLEWCTSKMNNTYENGVKCCMVDKDNCILSVHDSIVDLANYYGVDSSTASKQTRGEKGRFLSGMKARKYNEETGNYVLTRFD